MVGARPAGDDGEERGEERGADDDAHGLRDAEAEGEERGGQGPGGGVDAGDGPVGGVVAVGPGAAGGRDGDEVAVAPEGVGVAGVFVDGALQALGPGVGGACGWGDGHGGLWGGLLGFGEGR